MRKREVAAAEKRRTMQYGMTGEDVRLALAALDWEGQVHKVARVFGVTTRAIWRWQVDGAPPHIALAFDELTSGRIKERGVKWFLRRIGRSRNDGDRYAPKSTSRSAGAAEAAD